MGASHEINQQPSRNSALRPVANRPGEVPEDGRLAGDGIYEAGGVGTRVERVLENRRREGPETFAELDPRVEDVAYIVMTWAR